jgi:hypothetical protein
MSFPPDVYLIGAQKSGTTTLAYLLSQHPEICVAKSKEPHFFTYCWQKGLSWYESEFPNYQETICIDASTTYSMAVLSAEKNSRSSKKYLQNVPEKIYSLKPNAKFIYLLRDPIERTYSAYWHYFNRGRENKEFGKAIREDHFYIDVSNYLGQLSIWLEYFSASSFLFLLFEDLKKSPEEVAKECFRFIGLNYENLEINFNEVKNQSRHTNKLGRQFNGLFNTLDHMSCGYLAPSFLRKFTDDLMTDYNKKLPKIQDDDWLFLYEYFSKQKQSLESTTGMCLDKWQI